MKSIFVLQKFMDPNKMQDPEEVAEATANEAFDFGQCKLNAAGEISLGEFTRWYSTPDADEDDDDDDDDLYDDLYDEDYEDEEEEDEDEDEDEEEEEEKEKEKEKDTRYELSVKDKLEATKVLLGLGSVSVDDLLEILSESAPDGSLGKPSFLKCLQNIAALGGAPGYGTNFDMAMEVGKRIFDSFDAAGTGRVDFAELTSGLSVLCNSTAKEKIITTFTIHDGDGDGCLR